MCPINYNRNGQDDVFQKWHVLSIEEVGPKLLFKENPYKKIIGCFNTRNLLYLRNGCHELLSINNSVDQAEY